MDEQDPFGPVPPSHARLTVEAIAPPTTHRSTDAPRGNSALTVFILGSVLAVVMGVIHAMIVAQAGYMYSGANILIGWTLGRFVRGQLPEHNRGIAPVIAVPLAYTAGALVFLPAILDGLSRLSENLASHEQNLAFVRGYDGASGGGHGPMLWLAVAVLCLRAPLIAASAGAGVPLIFIFFSLVAAVRGSTKEH
jgi:hypothetical protein